MNKFDRIAELHRLLAGRKSALSLAEIGARLDCSPATARRAIEALRDFLGAPVHYDRRGRGYRYDPQRAPRYELPPLWLNDSELYALMVSHGLLGQVRRGLVAADIAPVRERIARLLDDRRLGAGELAQRVRIVQSAARPTDTENFRRVAGALGQRRRLRVVYRGRASDELTERTISPQRLVYYRDNWYLDAWCHLRKGLRCFAMDRLQPVYVSEDPAREVPEQTLREELGGAYGIMGGRPRHTAVLRFSSERARWLADEQWHPAQVSRVLPDGGVRLEVPYSRPEELILDILRFGPDVEVLEPPALREAVAARLREAVAGYSD